MKNTEQLSEIFLFNSLTPCQLEQISTFTSIKNISKGEYLFSEGQPASSFFILIKGRVKLFKLSAEGSEQILHVQQAGDLIAEAVIFEFDTYPAYCQAIENAQLIRISKREFRELLKLHHNICFKIMAAYSLRLRQMVNMIEELSLKDIKSRLANYLLNNSIIEHNQQFFPLTFSKKDLAALVGTIPETLSRTLNLFKKDQLIDEKKDRLIILNPGKLKTYLNK